MSKSKTAGLFVGAVFLIAAGFLCGVLLPTSGVREFLLRQTGSADSGGIADPESETPEALRLRVAALEAKLEKALFRAGKAAAGPDKKAGKEAPPLSRDDWEKMKKAGAGEKGKDGKGWAGKKGKKDWKPGLPEGMTKEEQDALVAEIVADHDWSKTAGALAAWARADRGGRGISMPEKQTLGDFFEVLGELRDVGVDFFDRRVARRFVPAMVSSLGADLDQGQADQITSFVDETAAQEENQPGPDPPLRYAQEKARDIQNTLDLEARMALILRPEQFAEYLAEVGDDPFRSGFGFKTQRFSCTGGSAEEVAEEVADLWGGEWYGLSAHREGMLPVIRRFVTEALGLPAVVEGLDPAARRRAVLERTKRALELQGAAELELPAVLPLAEEERRAFIEARWPVLDLVVE
jgi:hypothetical protein